MMNKYLCFALATVLAIVVGCKHQLVNGNEQSLLPSGHRQRPENFGAVGGEIHNKLPPPVFSTDGKHIAHIVKTARGVRVVRDGKADEEFDEISRSGLKFSADGGRLVYTARRGGKWYAVVDGKAESRCTAEGVKCSTNGKHVWYTAVAGDKRYFVMDGKRSPAYSRWAMGPFFTPDGSVHFAIYTDANTKAIMIVDGKVTAAYDGIALLDSCPSPFVNRLPAYGVRRGGKWLPVIFGKEQPARLGFRRSILYSSDGTHFAYVGTEGAGQFVVVDGKRGEAFRDIRPGSLGFQDSGQAYYIADMHMRNSNSERECLVVGDRKVLEFYGSSSYSNGAYRILLDPVRDKEPAGRVFRFQVVYRGVVDDEVFNEIGKPVSSRDRKHWAYAARRGHSWYLVVDGKAQAKNVDKLTVTGFLADGRVVYHTIKDKVGTVFMGKKSAPGTSRYPRLRLTEDSAHAVWLNDVGGETVLMIDGAPGPKFPAVLDNQEVSPSGRYATYRVKLSRDGERFRSGNVLVEGNRVIASTGLQGVTFGPDDFLAHVVREPGGKCSVFVNRRLIGRYDNVWDGAVFLSPSGRQYAFLATRGSRQMMVVDGAEGPEFERILTRNGGAHPPVMGPTSVTYFGMRKGKFYRTEQAWGKRTPPKMVNVPLPPDDPPRLPRAAQAPDVKELGAIGGEFDRTRSPVLSADGKHVAYFVKTAGGIWVVRDGKADEEFDEISWLKSSADGGRLVYTARRGDKWFGVVDGKLEGPYDATGVNRWSMLGCSPDGKHVWYSAVTGGNLRIVLDGKAGPVLSNAPAMRMAPNGDVYYAGIVKATGKTALVINGKTAGQYDGIRWLERYPGPISTGRRAAHAVKRGGKWFPVIFGKEQRACNVQGGVIYSSDGKHFAYIGTEDAGQFVVVDGKRGETFTSIIRESIGFRDSGQAYYIAGGKRFFEKKFLIVGGKKALEFYGLKMLPNGSCIAVMDPPMRGDPLPDSYSVRVIIRGAVDERVFNMIGYKGGPVCTVDGKHWAYAARRKRSWYLVVDGKAQAKDVSELRLVGFLADGTLVHHAVKDRVGTVFVGKRSAPGASRNLKLTKDSAHAIWVNRVGQEDVLMVDGAPGPKFPTVLDWKEVKVSTSGRYAAHHVSLRGKQGFEDGYVLTAGERIIASAGLHGVSFARRDRVAYRIRGARGKISVFVDERLIGEYDSVTSNRGHGREAFFSPDGRHYAFKATRGTRQMMVVNGVEGPEFERILTGDLFERSPEIAQTSVTYFGIRKGKLYRMVHALGK